MAFDLDDERRLGIGLALAGAGSLLALSPTVVAVPWRPATYSGTVLLIAGVLLVRTRRLS